MSVQGHKPSMMTAPADLLSVLKSCRLNSLGEAIILACLCPSGKTATTTSATSPVKPTS
jgi:hypothetical protein